MSDNVDRILAQRDMRSLTVAVCSQSSDAAGACRERLEVESGTIVKVNQGAAAMIATRDEAGFAELREMASKQI